MSQEQNDAPPLSSYLRSPLYEAHNASRYRRQDIIKRYEGLTNRRLLIYFANIAHPNSGIVPTDIAPFQDLLTDCEKGCDIYLLLQSPGGDIETAEKLVNMIHLRANSLRVIVADRAKSAATMMALAADEILMGATSELGPIDPQITIPNASGQPISRPARSFLDGLEQIKRAVVNEGGINQAYYPLLNQLDPALLDFCEKAIKRSQQFAKKWLMSHMLKHQPDADERAEEIANKLVDVNQYTSHGMVIDFDEAIKLGLTARYLEPDDPNWQLIWSLFVAYQVDSLANGYAKVYEGRRVSVIY